MLSRLLVAALFSGSAVAFAQGGPPPVGGPLPAVPTPAQNPTTLSKSRLGKALFWEEQVSSRRMVACGTCHIPATGGSDPRSGSAASRHPGADGLFLTGDDVFGSPGVPSSLPDGSYQATEWGVVEQVTGRKAPQMIDAAYATSLFWDGRALPTFRDPLTNAVVISNGGGLESQVVGPPMSEVEMGHIGITWGDLTSRLQGVQPLALAENVPSDLANWIGTRDYPALFQQAFGTPDITPVRFGMAVAAYERTLTSRQAPSTLLVQGPGPQPTLSPLENMGLGVFRMSGCAGCHGGPVLSNQQFFYTGVSAPNDDIGRMAVTGAPQDRGRMKTPSLLNVELRAPYFHDGSAATLVDVVDFYDRGGDFNAPNKDPRIQPLGLSQGQKTALLAFLSRPLTDARVAAESAPFDRPTLFSESNRRGQEFGVGTPGTGGIVPRIVALEPPRVGQSDFTIAIDQGFGGAPAILLWNSTPHLAGVPFRGTTLHVAIDPNVRFLRHGPLNGSGAGGGWGSKTIPLLSNPALIGTNFYVQWYTIDLGAPQSFAASRAVSFTYLP